MQKPNIKMFKSYLTLVLVLIFTACAGSKTTVIETKQKVETVTEITEKKLDTTIVIPGEKVSLFIPIESINTKGSVKPKMYIQKKGRAAVTVKIDSTGIEATSNCDSIAKRLDYYEKTFKQFRKEAKDTKTKVTEKKGYSKLELILYMIATAVVSFTAAYLLKTFKLL
jgi:hypothetical protein